MPGHHSQPVTASDQQLIKGFFHKLCHSNRSASATKFLLENVIPSIILMMMVIIEANFARFPIRRNSCSTALALTDNYVGNRIADEGHLMIITIPSSSHTYISFSSERKIRVVICIYRYVQNTRNTQG